jgi:hypothetical protein
LVGGPYVVASQHEEVVARVHRCIECRSVALGGFIEHPLVRAADDGQDTRVAP